MSEQSRTEWWWGRAHWSHCPSRNLTTDKVTCLRSVNYFCEVLSEVWQGAPYNCWWSGRTAQLQSPCSTGRISPPSPTALALSGLGLFWQLKTKLILQEGVPWSGWGTAGWSSFIVPVPFLREGTGNKMNKFLGKSSANPCGNFTWVDTENKVAQLGSVHLKGRDLASA